jgi:IS30 family transposase
MKHITKEQRYQIEAYLKSKQPISFIAKEIGKSASTIYREINRNKTKRGKYRAKYAQMLSEEKKERFSRVRKMTPSIEKRVRDLLEQEQWSPKEIVGFCKKNGIPMVSHERIYQMIRTDKEQGGNLYKHTRHRLKKRKRPVGGKKITIKNKTSIDDRSEIINNKQRFGDWEIDTIVGKNNKGAIVTIVERTTNFFMMKKLEAGKNAKKLAECVIDLLLPYKNSVLSITSDNGTEFAEHELISEKLNLDFYFAHAYSSWERGLSEYTNKLIRQYIPKKSNFDDFDNDYLADIQHKINRRPREKLDFEIPTKLFYNLVA